MPESNTSLQCFQSRHTNATIVFVLLAALMAASVIVSAIYTTIEVAIAVTIAFTAIIIIIAWLSPVWLNCGEKVDLS
jgi:uncharacterized membrane protein YjjP (DUF1212 family)